MESFIRIFRKILIGWLLVLFVGYVESSTFFLHSHFVKGQLITHSHPYSDTPDSGKHTHSTSQFITIASLSTLLMLAVLIGHSFRSFTFQSTIKVRPVSRYYSAKRLSCQLLRGPPAR